MLLDDLHGQLLLRCIRGGVPDITALCFDDFLRASAAVLILILRHQALNCRMTIELMMYLYLYKSNKHK